jgi:hypothetical protein
MSLWTSERYIGVNDMCVRKIYLCKRYICLAIFFKLMFLDYQHLQVVGETFNANIKKNDIFFKLKTCIKSFFHFIYLFFIISIVT